MGEKWLDLYADGRRIARLIRMLEKKIKKIDDDELMIKYANSIAYLTSKKIEIVNRVLELKELVKLAKKKYDYSPLNRDKYV